jgi:hypothetical protein
MILRLSLPWISCGGNCRYCQAARLQVVGPEEKYVFISYVREDADEVDKLSRRLRAAGIPVWTDWTQLAPGDDWKAKIREAIQSGSIVFLACFSDQSRGRNSSVQNEEITLAIDEFRKRPPGQTWLIPVRFDDGEVPEWDLGAGRTLRSLHYANLFGDAYDEHVIQLIVRIQEVMGTSRREPATVRAAIEQAADADRPALLRGTTTEMLLEEKRKIELDGLIAQEVSRVLAAIRDPERFPRKLSPGTPDEQFLQLAALAIEYWRLVEPFCWSLNVAARWAAPTALTPWTKGLRAFCTEALKIEGGVYHTVNDLKHILCLTAIFVAAMSSSGEQRWDNFKSLLIDATVINPRREHQRVSIIEAESPWAAFSSSQGAYQIPRLLARSAVNSEDLETAWSVCKGQRQPDGDTPVANWLHAILRPVFNEQFLDVENYDSEFDAAEVMLGVVAEDLALMQSTHYPERRLPFRNRWFGRSAWSASHHSDQLKNLRQEMNAQGAAWAPLASGLFGGQLVRATKASSSYAETFDEHVRHIW